MALDIIYEEEEAVMTTAAVKVAERAILETFARMGKGAGDHLQMVALMSLINGDAPYTTADMNAALQGMADKGWIEPGRPNTYVLTPDGAKAI